MSGVRASTALLVTLVCGTAGAAQAADLLYVADFSAGKGVSTEDAQAASRGFCHEFEDRAGTDKVVCEDAIRTLMDVAAAQAALGGGSNASTGALQRLEDARWIVDGNLRQGKHGLILEVRLSDASYAGGAVVAPVKVRYRFLQKGIQGGVGGVHKTHKRLAKRMLAQLNKSETGKGAPPPSMK